MPYLHANDFGCECGTERYTADLNAEFAHGLSVPRIPRQRSQRILARQHQELPPISAHSPFGQQQFQNVVSEFAFGYRLIRSVHHQSLVRGWLSHETEKLGQHFDLAKEFVKSDDLDFTRGPEQLKRPPRSVVGQLHS